MSSIQSYIREKLLADEILEGLLTPYHWIVASEGETLIKNPSLIIAETTKLPVYGEAKTLRFIFSAYGRYFDPILERVEAILNESSDMANTPKIHYIKIEGYDPPRYEEAIQTYARNMKIRVEIE